MNRTESRGWSSVPSWFFQLRRTGLITLVMILHALPEAWAAQASPSSISFQAVQGGLNPSNQVVVISRGASRQVRWKASDNASWLSASPGSGAMTTSAELAVGANISGMPAGTYNASLTVTLSKGGTVSIPVTLTIVPTTSTKSPQDTTTATLSWAPNTDSDLAGYKVYVGTSSGAYGIPLDVGNVTSYTIGNLTAGTTYYFAVTAYDQSKNESVYSSEVSKSMY